MKNGARRNRAKKNGARRNRAKKSGAQMILRDSGTSRQSALGGAVLARARRVIASMMKLHTRAIGARQLCPVYRLRIRPPTTCDDRHTLVLSGSPSRTESGARIGVFPEGTRSLGRELRARSGAGRLALAVPEATIVCARVTGTTDIVRLPKRPSVTVDFFAPAGDRRKAEDSATELTAVLLAELRDGAPPTVPGRTRTAAEFGARLEAVAGPDLGRRA